MSDWAEAVSKSGVRVPVRFFPASNSSPKVVLLPALGVPAGFYRRLGEGLAAHGVSVLLMEQRGHGKSPYRAGKGADFGFQAYLEEDIPAALAWLAKAQPSGPLYLGGHSLGGHMASIMAARHGTEVAGIVHLACGFPHHRLFGLSAALMVRFVAMLVPVMTALLGYYPGHRLGFGGREYRGLMADWRRWAMQGCYDDAALPGIEAAMAAYSGRLLSIAFDQDDYASDAAVAYSYSRFQNAAVSVVKLTVQEQGDYLGHFDWARQPGGVIDVLADWLSQDEPCRTETAT